MNVVIKKYGRKPSAFNINDLVKAAKEMTGAEIDSAFTEAMFTAFAQNREVNTTDFITHLEQVVPQSKTNKHSIDKLRQAVEGTLRLASDAEIASGLTDGRKIKVK